MGIKKIIIVWITLTVPSFITAQNYIPYYNLVHEAEFAIFEKQYSRAVQYLDDAFLLEKPQAKDGYLMAYCLDKIDSKGFRERIEELLIQASQSNGLTTHWMEIQPLSISFEKDFYTNLERNEAVWDSLTRPARDTIDYYLSKDQEVRRVLVDSIDPYYGEESTEYELYITKMSENDSIYQSRSLDYVKTYAFPGINKSGTDIAGTILVHIHSSLFDEYRSILLEELKKGNIAPYMYGSMVDRINCYNNGEAFYRAYNIGTEHCQPSKADAIKNRLSIGMSPYFQGTRRYVQIDKAAFPVD